MQEPERKLGGDRQSIWSIPKSEQATSSASSSLTDLFRRTGLFRLPRDPGLKTGESATIIIAHTGVTGGAAAVLSLATAEGERLAMVAARYIEERYLNPLRAKRIKREEEAKKEIREEARAKGLALAQARAQPSPSVTPSPTPNGECGTNGGWPLRRRESPSTSPRPPHFGITIGV